MYILASVSVRLLRKMDDNSRRIDLTLLDIDRTIYAIPEKLRMQTEIKIALYSVESSVLKPCERTNVKTGIIIPSYLAISHTAKFCGLTNGCGLETEDYIIPYWGKELTVSVTNFSNADQRIPINMPLGYISIYKHNQYGED